MRSRGLLFLLPLVLGIVPACASDHPQVTQPPPPETLEEVSPEECFSVDVPAYLKAHEAELYSRVVGKTKVLNVGIHHHRRRAWGDHFHRDHDKVIFVLGGAGQFRMEGRLIEMKPGVLISVPKGAVHGLRSVGEEPLAMMWIYIPPMDLGNVDQVDVPG